MKAALLAAVLLFSLPAQADRLWLHGLSDHASPGEYNEVNEGLGVELQVTDRASVEFGRYRNSFERPTRYVIGHYEFARRGLWRFGGALGTADNYDCAEANDESTCRKMEDGEGVPFGGLTIGYWRARLLLIPNEGLDRIEVVSLSAYLIEWQ